MSLEEARGETTATSTRTADQDTPPVEKPPDVVARRRPATLPERLATALARPVSTPLAIGLLFVLDALIAIVMTFPFAFRMSDSVAGAGDNLLNTWILAWVAHALTTNPLHLYEANIFFPFHLSLTYSETMLPAALPAGAIIALTNNPILAHNLLWLLSFPLAALSMQVLAFHLTRHIPGSIIAGLIFAFCCYRFGQLSHLQLQLIFWLPLCVWLLHLAYESGKLKFALLAGVCFVLQALTSFYYGFFAAIAVGVFLVFEAISLPTVFFQRKTLATTLGFIVVAGVGLIPFAEAYFASQQLYGFERNVNEIVDLSASISDYFSAPPTNIVYGQMTRAFANHGQFPGEHFVFPGLIVLALAGIGIFAFRWRRRVSGQVVDEGETTAVLEIAFRGSREQWRYRLLAVVALVLSFGPALRMGDVEIPLPYAVLYTFVPGFTALRAPVRLAVLVMLALSVLAAFGLKRLDAMFARRYLAWRGSVRAAAFTAVGFAVLCEYASMPVAMTQIGTGAAVPPVYRWLAEQPRGPIAEVPSTDASDFAYAYYSVYHWDPLVNGHSGFVPPDYPQLQNAINAFPEPEALDMLAAVGVRDVIVHRAAVGDTRADQISAEAAQDQPRVSLTGTFGSDDVYELAPRAVVGQDAAQVRLSLPAQVNAFTPVTAILTIQNAGSTPIVRSADALTLDAAWDGDSTARSVVRPQLPLVIEPGTETSTLLPLPPARSAGNQQLRVVVTGTFSARETGSVGVLGAGLPDSRQRDQLDGAVDALNVPPTVFAGQPLQVQISVRNTGQAIWLANADGNLGRVSFALRGWYTPDGQPVLNGDGTALGSRALLPGDIYPGQSITLHLRSPSPGVPGRYTARFDLVSEFISWFVDLRRDTERVSTIDVLAAP